MGIQGLLPLLKSIMNPIHIKELEGCFVAVDTYSWLHKGALSCSTDLCKGQPTTKHIDYCMHRVNMLRHYGITPILVFDGGPLPMKSDQEVKRARSRKENLSRAMEHESNGNQSAAYECYQKAVDISPSIAYDLIKVLKQANVSYVVAPYEADAQMTFLALNKHVDAVITEDSDLIVFGCTRIIYKMDKFGQGVEFKNELLQHNRELNFAGFTQMMLIEMCILSGCDYLQSLPGMGLKKAHTLMRKFKSYKNVIKHLKYNTIEVTPLYEESFQKAILTFRHQRVYDPATEDIVHLSEPTGFTDEDLDFLGPSMSKHVAIGIARGDLDPFTKEPIQRECHASEKVFHGNYQLKNFKPDGDSKKIDLPVQKNLLTNYFCFASLEAKRKFRAPRIIPSESDDSSSPRIDVHEHGSEINDSSYLEAQGHGSSDEKIAVRNKEMRPFTLLQIPVCKPCSSSDKDRDSDRKNRKITSVNENGIVRSTYFLKRSREDNAKENKNDVDKGCDNKLENIVTNEACEPVSALLRGTSQKNEKTVSGQSSYFQQKFRQNANYNKENVIEKYSFQSRRLVLKKSDYKTIEYHKNRVRSSYFEESSINENNEIPESESLLFKDLAVEPCNYNILESPSSTNSLERGSKQRKTAQIDPPIEDANDNSWTPGPSTSDIDEETKTAEAKFGCNISHLDRYSDIAEKSLENFVSVISSFKFNSSGSRASGLRAPLKDVQNNCMKSPTHSMDLRKFAYAPTKPTLSRYHREA